MNKTLIRVALGAAAITIAIPVIMTAQGKPTAATYITKEEVDKVNALPGVDRTIKVLDIGGEHFSVGIIHRVAPAAAGAGRAGGAGAGGRGRGTPPPPDCGEITSTPPTSGGAAGTIAHDSQTEGYLIVSGGGTMLTGGKIYNGRKSGPNDEVTTTLNGPSCSGTAFGDVTRKDVKPGDIIIIPAGVPHGWTNITTEVTYLSFRPSGQTLTVGYVNPAIK
jgi:mannose-6-phosphate isomerase-like protein (cupin superfamily)